MIDVEKRREYVRKAATLVVKLGTVMIPILERAEKELLDAQSNNDALDRARRYLDAA